MQYFIFVLGILLALIIVFVGEKKGFFSDSTKYIYIIVSGLLCSLVLEIFTFNFQAYDFVKKDCSQKSYVIDMSGESLQENIQLEKNASDNGNIYVISIDDINTVVEDIDIIPTGFFHKIAYNISYTDEAISVLLYTNSNEQVIVSGLESSQHIKTHFAGKTQSLKFQFLTDVNDEISNIRIQLNYKKAFDYNLLRIILVALVIMILMVIYHTKDTMFNVKSIKQRIVILAFIIVQFLIMLFLEVAPYIQFDGQGKYQGYVFSDDTEDVYHELTMALAQGKLDLNGVNTDSVEEENQQIEALSQLDNPYDWDQREELSYKWDRAFYNGKYYCYFGIVPVLFIYLPIYIFSGMLVSSRMVTLLLTFLNVVLMSMIVLESAKKWKGKLNFWVVISVMAGFVNASMILYCMSGSKFYEVATLSALACALLGIYMLMKTFVRNNTNKKCLFTGALFMALSVGCRPNFVLASFIIVPIVMNGLTGQTDSYGECSSVQKASLYIKNIFRKENIKSIIVFAIPYLFVAVGLMVYNYLRFGSPLEFGAKYQLTVYDTSYYKATDFGKIPIALARGILMLPTVSSVFPYVGPVMESSNYIGYFYEMAYLGIMASPVMWILLMLPWSAKRGMKENKVKGFSVMAFFIGLLMCYLTTALGGTSLRYSVDFAWMFYIPVMFIIFDLYTRADKRKLRKYAFGCILGLVIITSMINIGVCLSPEASSIRNNTPEIFYRLEKMIVFWK